MSICVSLESLMTTHSDWYLQRYGSASGNRKHAEAAAAKTAKYRDRKKDGQRFNKAELLAQAEQVFVDAGIPWKVVSPAVWLIDCWGELIYFYPTTSRWRPKGKHKIYYSYGASDFLEKVYRFQQPRSYTLKEFMGQGK